MELLLKENKGMSHYVYMKGFNRFMYSRAK